VLDSAARFLGHDIAVHGLGEIRHGKVPSGIVAIEEDGDIVY